MASYRKVKKAAKKAQREGLLEPGPMFQKWSKAGRRNPLTRKNAMITMPLKTFKRALRAVTSGKQAKIKARVH